MAKPRRRRLPKEPQQNNWLYACPPGATTAEIEYALGAERSIVTEMSAHDWQTHSGFAAAFRRAYGYPDVYLGEMSEAPPNWDAVNDLIQLKGWRGDHYLGDLVILRRIPQPPPDCLVKLVVLLGSHNRRLAHDFHYLPPAHVLVVLENWRGDTLRARWPHNHTEVFRVNMLPRREPPA